MFETVSESHTGQNLPPPDREERDDAYSSGAGRKAVEVPVPEEQQLRHARHQAEAAPIGLDLETKAEELE